VGSITQNVSGDAGAKLFAASTTSEFTSVTFDSGSGSAGYAIAEVRYSTTSAVPEPGAYALMGSLGLTGAAFLRRRRAR
jgi:hypothetical protein